MGKDKENKRTCFKCGSSPSDDGIKLFRVLKPGVRNLVRCEQWVKYLFPDRNVSSIEFQMKLYNEHKMLCARHFKAEDFKDSSRKFLLRTAIPCDVHTEHNMLINTSDHPGPSGTIPPFRDLTNAPATEHLQATQPPPSSFNQGVKSNREKILRAKCQKYLQKICQLHKQIKHLNTKAMLNALADDKSVKKLSSRITPSFLLLLQGQIRNFKRKIRGRRWSKKEKIIALRMYKRSPTCYRLLRRLFTLPSPGILKTLLNRIQFNVGCNKSVMEVLKKFARSLTPANNEFILMFDEMSIKKHLNYDMKHDIIEGFQDHGRQGRSELVAGYALVFMIGGIRQRVKQPIAHYFSSSYSTADRLAIIIKEVLDQCSEAGIHIAGTVCDMDGVNRRALTILGATPEHPSITVGGKEIVTMFDTPHLLKCFRNLFMKYDIECETNIKANNKRGRGVAKWSYIIQFHEIDSTNPNFVFAPCLKKDHLNPNTKQKMKVNLAAQVLSHTVAAGMYATISDGLLTADATVTANVISNMDKLFDSLNSDCSDLRRGKPHATNMTATSPHIDLFAEMKLFFSTLKFVGINRKPPSLKGWVWTLNAVERLWRNLVQKHGSRSLATRRLQQDPLENLFGCIRGNCGSNTNPTCGQFVAGLKTAILSGLSHMGTLGNCETDNHIIINNFERFLSVSQSKEPQTEPQADDATVTSSITRAILALEVDEAIKENSGEVQACAYVCGFLAKHLPVKECSNCKDFFLSKQINEIHNFVEFKEYRESEKHLNYVSKSMITCVEFCAANINQFLKDNAHTTLIKKKVFELLNNNVNFDFVEACTIHKNDNIKSIIESTFFICIKRFCIMKNRSLAEEASASALKRKMEIIMHK